MNNKDNFFQFGNTKELEAPSKKVGTKISQISSYATISVSLINCGLKYGGTMSGTPMPGTGFFFLE